MYFTLCNTLIERYRPCIRSCYQSMHFIILHNRSIHAFPSFQQYYGYCRPCFCPFLFYLNGYVISHLMMLHVFPDSLAYTLAHTHTSNGGLELTRQVLEPCKGYIFSASSTSIWRMKMLSVIWKLCMGRVQL